MFSKDTKTNGSEPIAVPEQAPRMERAAMPGGAPSIISADLKIQGNLTSNGDVQIDGTIEGNVSSQSATIGDSAHVNGVISAKLMRNARVTGDIVHESLAVEAGASIEGNLRRMGAQSATRPAQAAKAPQSNGKSANA
jgi:cytoskeletal protein CcmA (bactofilin family)